MTFVAVLALFALGVAGVSFWRLSRLPSPREPVDERTYENLGPGDVVLADGGDWLVAGRAPLLAGSARADVFTLRSGREQRWLLVGEAGAVAFLPQMPQTPDVEREVAALGGRKLDRATVDLLPGK